MDAPPTQARHNLLLDPLLRAEGLGGLVERITLPGLLARLGRDEVLSLPGLRRHQQEPFHVFLCYLAGACLARAGVTDPAQPEAFWLAALRRLAGREDDHAFTLFVADPTAPAFLQPPAPSRADFEGAYKPKAATPDELDVLVTAKDHDLKISRIAANHPEAWLYALVSLQTTTAFLGSGNYWISRMNGGFGSRPIVSFATSRAPGRRFRDEVGILLEERPRLLRGEWLYAKDGHVLTWVLTWDRQTRLKTEALDPFYLEIARALRLVLGSAGALTALGAPTVVARIAISEGGLTGDPWSPIRLTGKKGPTVLTVAGGFSPALLSNLLFQRGYELAAMQRPRPETAGVPAYLLVSVLAGGKGTTDGYHTEALRVPARASQALFGGGPARDRLAEISQGMLNDAETVDYKILRPALFTLYEAGRGSIDYGKREVGAWVGAVGKDFSRRWEEDYFPHLWRAAEEGADMEALGYEWIHHLAAAGRVLLAAAEQSAPLPAGRHYRARVAAEARFDAALRKQFPTTFGQRGEESEDATHRSN
jgi:CRISPR system Cascade subunit CasA